MKKAIALAMASVMAAGLLAGCGGSAANSTAASSEAASTSTEAASADSTAAATEAHTVNTTDPITLTISWWGGDARQAARHSQKNTPPSPLSALTARGTAGRKLSPLPWLPATLPT